MRPRLLLLTLLALLFAALQADAQQIVAIEFPSTGTYLIEVTVDAQGNHTARPFPVIKLDGTTPVPPDPPDPGTPDDLGKTVRTLLSAVTDPDKAQTAQAVAMIYEATADMAEQGSIKTMEDLRKATNLLYDPLMKQVGKLDQWKGFKAGVDAAIKADSLSDLVDDWGVVVEVLREVSP